MRHRCPALEVCDRGRLRLRLFSGGGSHRPGAPVYAPLPAADRRALEAEFGRAQEMDAAPPGVGEAVRRNRMCRGAVSGAYAAHSLATADLVCVARYGDTGPIVGIVTAYRPWSLHPEEGRPYCLPHEVYVDVVCGYQCPYGCGRLLFAGFVRYLRRAPTESHVRALRLYSTATALRHWVDRWGFVEAETRLVGDHCVYTEGGPRHYAHEAERGWERTWRLTLVLGDTDRPGRTKKIRPRVVPRSVLNPFSHSSSSSFSSSATAASSLAAGGLRTARASSSSTRAVSGGGGETVRDRLAGLSVRTSAAVRVHTRSGNATEKRRLGRSGGGMTMHSRSFI